MSAEQSTPPRRTNRVREEAARLRRRRIRLVAFGLPTLVALAALYVWSLFQPVSAQSRPIPVTVPAGAGVLGTGAALERAGIVRSAYAFDFYVRWHGESSRIKAGRYLLSPDMDLDQILRQFKKGPLRALAEGVRVTIPEGFTLKQIAQALQRKAGLNAATFLEFATDTHEIAGLHADFPLPKNTLEGYLFPDTYHFPARVTAEEATDTMVMNFYSRFYRPYQREIEASGESVQALVTKASLIEREARVDGDRPLIAGVIDNRLKRGMKLEVDATVEYALPHHKQQLSRADLAIPSPYNTYLHKGLPPGPIACPGLPSLLAALHPEQSDYLYYVLGPDGAHIFSRTRAEHEAAARRVKAEKKASNADRDKPGG